MNKLDVKFRLKQRKLKGSLFKEGGMSTENVLITMRVKYLNMHLEFSTGYHIDVDCWNSESGCALGANRAGQSADEINGGLLRLVRNIKSAAKMYEEMEKIPNPKQFKATFEKIRSEEQKFLGMGKSGRSLCI